MNIIILQTCILASLPFFREIPSVDIHNILIEYNGGDDGGIGVVEIETCAAWLLAGRTAELALGRLAYPVVQRRQKRNVNFVKQQLPGLACCC